MDLQEIRKLPTDNGESEVNQTDAPPISVASKKQPVQPTREFSFGRRLAFTIDHDSIQMAVASHMGSYVKLIDTTKLYFDSAHRSSESRQHLMLATIKEYVRKFGGRWPTISLALTGPQTALRSVMVPKLKGAELDAALTYEGRRQIPFPAEDCWIDTRVVEAISQGDEHHLRASVLAATKIAVQELLSPFEELGLEVSRIYHTQDVIGQLLKSLPGYQNNADYTLINVHNRSTEIAYFRGRNLEFYHVSSLGSSFLANSSDPTVFEYFAESLTTEIQNSLDFYGGQFSDNRDPEIFIYGDLAYTEELIELISNRYGLKFSRFPGSDLKLNFGQQLSHDDICVNLSAVAVAVSREKIANLLPTQAKQKLKLKKINLAGTATLVVLGVILIAQWLVSASSLSNARERLAQLEYQTEKFQASKMFATYNLLKRKLIANQAFIAKTQEEPSYLGLNLKELSHQVPKSVHLYNLEFTADAPDRNYLLSGLITTDLIPPELVLAEMVENLLASPFYEDVIVERHVKRHKTEGTILDFTLSMKAII